MSRARAILVAAFAFCASLGAGFQGQTSNGHALHTSERSSGSARASSKEAGTTDAQETVASKRDRLMRSGNHLVLGSTGNAENARSREDEPQQGFTENATNPTATELGKINVSDNTSTNTTVMQPAPTPAPPTPTVYTSASVAAAAADANPDSVAGFTVSTCQYVDAGYGATEHTTDRSQVQIAPNQVWDCSWDANFIVGNQPCWEVEVPLYYITDEFTQANPHEWCKTFCLQLSVTCTGFYIFEEGRVQGNDTNKFKCGFYTKDMLMGKQAIRDYTASGRLCLRVGKNFQCSEDRNFIETKVREDFSLKDVPLLHADGSPRNKDEALDWCKEVCDTREISCATFWFQERKKATKHGLLANTWKCGLYANKVQETNEEGLRSLETKGELARDGELSSGYVCDAI